jgi:alkylation response protein AidB-like acyl-CoA dehydrogenase
MSMITPEELDALLGDPGDDASPYGFAAAVARDEADEFPSALCDALVRSGFHLNYLPPHWGGQLVAFDASMRLVRTAARRDVNIMPGTMFSIIAATCLQLHADQRQQDQAADILRRGGAVGFALTEADHGSDLLGNEVRLTDGRLTGEKWMVGLGCRCDAVYVLARTGERGPGAFSALLLDVTGASAEQLDRAPATRTGGMRGIDLATLRFTGLPVPDDALVGKQGEGLEAAVKAQQVVRLMSIAGSLGCMDTALRLTLDFASARVLGRSTLIKSPYPRRELAVAAAAMLAADAVSLTAARGIHVLPETFSVWALSAKHAVAEAADELTRRCATVLATRAVLRSGPPGAGLFQKLQRDCGVVRVIDASTLANLRGYAAQLPTLLARLAAAADAASVDSAGSGAAEAERVRPVFALDADLPPYDPGRLDMVVRGVDPVLGGLPAVAGAVADALADGALADGVLADGALADDGAAGVADLVRQVAKAVTGLAAVAKEAGSPGADPNALADLAERYSWLHAAACCVHLWWSSRHLPLYGTAPGSAGWLGAALGYLLARADGTDPRRHGQALLPALDVMSGLHRHNQLFSAVPVQLVPHPGGTESQEA